MKALLTENQIGPSLGPYIAVCSDSCWVQMVWCHGCVDVIDENPREDRRRDSRIDKHAQREVLLEGGCQHEVDQRL